MTSKLLHIGFIGLGIMGLPMALRLRAGGYELFFHTRSEPKPEVIAAGAVRCASAKEVAERADIVFVMVPDTPDVA